MSIRINPEMVLLAREFRKFTQKKLATLLNIGQGTLSKIENGFVTDIDDEVLDSLESILSFPRDFFLQVEDLVGIGSSAYYYRKREKLTATDRKWIHSVLNIKRLHLKKLLNSVDMQHQRTIPRLEICDYGNPSSVARALRGFWNLPDGPIRNLTNLLEDCGVLVLPCDFKTDAMDATSIWMADIPPMIFINKDIPGDRWRFTLAHELGHLVMHEVPDENQEDQADEFASEFLVPENEISYQFNEKLSLKKFSSLKTYWKVSIAALIVKARKMDKINEYQYKYYFTSMSKMGYRKNEPNPIPREMPSSLEKLINVYREQMSYTDDELCKFINISCDKDCNELYGLNVRPKLVVVK